MSSEGKYVNFDLPSRGVLYENALTSVEVRPMFTTEEKYLAGGRRDWHSVVDKLLSPSGCIKDLNGMSPPQLLSSDRLFLLFAIRKLSYGEKYSFMIKCDECNTQFNHRITLLDDLKITEMADDAKEPFFFTFPICGTKIGYRLLRGSDERAIERYTKNAMQNRDRIDNLEDPAHIHRLARHIVSVDGQEIKIVEAEHFVETLQANDASHLRDEIDKVNGGVDLELNITCRSCGIDIEEIMPFTKNFFRATS